MISRLRHLTPLLALVACTARRDAPPSAGRDTVVVFAAASLAGPMRGLLDAFSRTTGTVVQEEHGASLELARRITELHRVPDVILLADHEVFPQVLAPAHVAWYVRFAGNRMVVAYTARSRHAGELRGGPWWQMLLRDDVRVARADPATAPAGYRALLTYDLAERFYHLPGLARRLADRTPAQLLRSNATELAALLETGEADYIVEYESLARSHGFEFVVLPPAIDLGDARRATEYAAASVRVPRGRDSVTIRGMPILYGVSVPRGAPHPAAGARLVAMLLSADASALLRRQHIAMLDEPEVVGDSVPDVVRARLAP